jgi:NAD(P)H-nitrite reductase large subunit
MQMSRSATVTPLKRRAAISLEPPRLTRCECAELSFEEIARRIRTEGITLEQVMAQTGCGGTCTACIPDLQHYLASR